MSTSLNFALSVARIAMTFGRVERATMHPDGQHETDTTHTVMLALLVAEYAHRWPAYDVGLAVKYALVHDLPETFAGDTNTAFGLSPDQRARKLAREAASLGLIENELGDSWTVQMIRRYEKQDDPEARLVRFLDKVVPRLTVILNGGRSLRALGMSADAFEQRTGELRAMLSRQYPEFMGNTPTGRLFDEAADSVLEIMRDYEERTKKQ